MSVIPLPTLLIEDLVRNTLREDLGRRGDITSTLLIPEDRMWTAQIKARKGGVIAGLSFARTAFSLMDAETVFMPEVRDGDVVAGGAVIATIKGRAVPMLTAERTALNFMTHLSGIATLTRQYVEAVAPHRARICCTRKTLPGLRAPQKYAVLAGGGRNHRFGLDDAVLIKDNHIAIMGSLRETVQLVRDKVGHMTKIEVEVDSLEQLTQLLDLPVDAVLLDNMSPATLTEAVQLVDGRFTTEASGGVSLETVADIAASGVEMISVGALTHSAAHLDLGLDDA